MYDTIKEETQTPDGERCFLIHGYEGRGKTTVAQFVADEYADHDTNTQTLKGNKVIQSVVDELIAEGHTHPLWGSRRSLVINECDNINKDVQNVLHDWLQDELPSNYVVLVTTNKKPCQREEWDKMSESERKDHLTPKFSSRFTWYEAPSLPVEELAHAIKQLTGIPEKAAMVCAKNGKGDIRHSLKEVQKAITSARIRKQKQSHVYSN